MEDLHLFSRNTLPYIAIVWALFILFLNRKKYNIDTKIWLIGSIMWIIAYISK